MLRVVMAAVEGELRILAAYFCVMTYLLPQSEYFLPSTLPPPHSVLLLHSFLHRYFLPRDLSHTLILPHVSIVLRTNLEEAALI